MAKQKISGKRSWRPATLLDVQNKVSGLNYRWCDKDPANLMKKQAEGWEFASKSKVTHIKVDATNSLQVADPINGEGSNLSTSITEYRDCVLMTIDDETLEARNEYFAERTDAQCITPEKYKSFAKQVFAEGKVDSSTLYDPNEIE